MHPTLLVGVTAAAAIGAGLALAPPNLNGLFSPGCVIKGNISFRTGERIYHVPGGEFYEPTQIDEGDGERWFCTEAEAVASGWRRSPNSAPRSGDRPQRAMTRSQRPVTAGAADSRAANPHRSAVVTAGRDMTRGAHK